jgi:hypothetical protein
VLALLRRERDHSSLSLLLSVIVLLGEWKSALGRQAAAAGATER